MDLISLRAFADEFEKIAKAKKERTAGQRVMNGLYGAGLLVASPKAVQMGAHRVLGAQAIHHGTDVDSAERIMRNGLDPSFGGSGVAQQGDMYRDRFVGGSRDYAHVTELPSTAKRYARQAAKGGEGAVLSGAMPYEDFAGKFIRDQDSNPVFDFKTKERIDPSVFRTTIRDIADQRLKNPGGWLRSLAAHPGRALTGAALLATPLAGAALLSRTSRNKSPGGDS